MQQKLMGYESRSLVRINSSDEYMDLFVLYIIHAACSCGSKMKRGIVINIFVFRGYLTFYIVFNMAYVIGFILLLDTSTSLAEQSYFFTSSVFLSVVS